MKGEPDFDSNWINDPPPDIASWHPVMEARKVLGGWEHYRVLEIATAFYSFYVEMLKDNDTRKNFRPPFNDVIDDFRNLAFTVPGKMGLPFKRKDIESSKNNPLLALAHSSDPKPFIDDVAEVELISVLILLEAFSGNHLAANKGAYILFKLQYIWEEMKIEYSKNYYEKLLAESYREKSYTLSEHDMEQLIMKTLEKKKILDQAIKPNAFKTIQDIDNLGWHEIEIKIAPREMIAIKARDVNVRVSSGEFGLLNKNTGAPNQTYQVLVSFASNEPVAKSRKMTVTRVRDLMKEKFGISKTPIELNGKLYSPKFKISFQDYKKNRGERGEVSLEAGNFMAAIPDNNALDPQDTLGDYKIGSSDDFDAEEDEASEWLRNNPDQ